jgi:hypothetical protein
MGTSIITKKKSFFIGRFSLLKYLNKKEELISLIKLNESR